MRRTVARHLRRIAHRLDPSPRPCRVVLAYDDRIWDYRDAMRRAAS